MHYEGEPNGLKIHRDGRIFVADHQVQEKFLSLGIAAGTESRADFGKRLATEHARYAELFKTIKLVMD